MLSLYSGMEGLDLAVSPREDCIPGPAGSPQELCDPFVWYGWAQFPFSWSQVKVGSSRGNIGVGFRRGVEGPRLASLACLYCRHACVPVDFEEVHVSSNADEEDIRNAIMAIRRNRVALKGELRGQIGCYTRFLLPIY